METTETALVPMPAEAVERETPSMDIYVGIASSAFTKEQQDILTAPLTEDEIAIRPDDGMLYMPQIFYRQRLIRAFGVGGWAMRSNGTPYVDRTKKTKKNEEAPEVFYTGLLYVNGRFVAEAMGKGSWIVSNPKSDYGTALESAKSDALSRCCKDLGIAWKLWDKAFADAWKKENAVNHNGDWIKRSALPSGAKPASNIPTANSAKPGWAKVPQESSVVAEARRNDETLASMAGGPIPVPENTKVRKGNRRATVSDLTRHLSKAMPDVVLQKLTEDGRVEVTDEKTGVVTIEDKGSTEQIAAIHILKNELKLSEPEYRLALKHYYTVDTSKLLTKAQASDCIDRLKNYKERGEGVR